MTADEIEIPYSFYYDKSIIVTGMVFASISTLSSTTTLSIIFRSNVQFKSIYHRIITWICVADILTSISIALSTIPMPKDHQYPFEFPSFGNDATCTAQGVIYLIGNALVFWFNGLLNIYYLCSLGFNISEKKILKFVEMPLTSLGLVLCVGLNIYLVVGSINPGPNDPFCTVYNIPCEETQEGCNEEGSTAFNFAYLTTLSMGFTTLMVCMSYITLKFNSNQRKLKSVEENNEPNEEESSFTEDEREELAFRIETLKYSQETARTITIQALMYIFAFNCVWVFGFIEFLIDETKFNASRSSQDALAVLRMIFQPSQGTFNLIIFVFHKVYDLRKDDEDIPFLEAISTTIFHPALLPEDQNILSNFNLVVEDMYLETQKRAMMMDYPSSGQSHMKSSTSINPDVQVASVGAMSSNSTKHSNKASSKVGSVGSLNGFSSMLKSDVSNNLVSTGNGSVSTPLEGENTSNSFVDDNDISYAKETTFSNDDNLSFKSFFSWNKEKRAKHARSKTDSNEEHF